MAPLRSSRYIHVPSFGRFDEITHLVEKTSVLTHDSPVDGESGARARLAFRILALLALDSVAVSVPQTRVPHLRSLEPNIDANARKYRHI